MCPRCLQASYDTILHQRLIMPLLMLRTLALRVVQRPWKVVQRLSSTGVGRAFVQGRIHTMYCS